MSRIFRRVGGLHPGRSVFDLSHSHLTTGEMGELIPMLCEEVNAGDKFKISNEVIIRMQPLVAPILHEINAFMHYYFVPYRLLWKDWEKFHSGGPKGDFEEPIPKHKNYASTATRETGSIWDYFGYNTRPQGYHVDSVPHDLPRRAYLFIFNEYYRDQNLQIPYAFLEEHDDDEDYREPTNRCILNRNWEKDYFTSSLPFQQRGLAPALPISGYTNAIFPGDIMTMVSRDDLHGGYIPFLASTVDQFSMNLGPYYNNLFEHGLGGPINVRQSDLNNNKVDLSTVSTFNIADLRLAFQIQKWLERNARAGVRYTEFLRAHFGVAPSDARLDRPEYIGGSKSPIIISEVLQTSQSTDSSPQGAMAGHGLIADRTFCASYTAQEPGVIMGILSVMPRTVYCQGMPRMFLRKTRYDFYFPEFAHLSEQAIITEELFANSTESANKRIFGFIGRYDELRVRQSKVTGLMRRPSTEGGFSHWHLARLFNNHPRLNESFIECVPDKRIFAVEDQPGLIINVSHNIKAIRPLPIISSPGLIDHF